MRLRVLLPTHVAVDEQVRKIIAEGEEGAFCLLPRHVDLASALVPGLLAYETDDGQETFLALDGGTLVKCGSDVLVSTPDAVIGPDLGRLEHAVERSFKAVDEHQRKADKALAKIEADLIRRFIELEEHA